MFYLHTPTMRYPLSNEKIRRENPNVSFATPFVPPPDYVKVASYEQPSHDPLTHTVREVTPALVNDVWTQQWEVVALTPEEIQQRYNEQAKQVRTERNNKLAASDWTQVIDAPVDQAAWASYRQQLRDVTSQAGFPWEIEWPKQP